MNSSRTRSPRVMITGANGFIGTHLAIRLREQDRFSVSTIVSETPDDQLDEAICNSDVIFHLAGVNRAPDAQAFEAGNHLLTKKITDRIRTCNHRPRLVLASSIQASMDNPYGRSKRAAEKEVFEAADSHLLDASVFRLPNVFGKWSKPYYNSAVATFCHQVAHGETPSVHDARSPLRLVYIDDVIETMLRIVDGEPVSRDGEFCLVTPEFETTVGEVAEIIESFRMIRNGERIPDFQNLLHKYLYSTYLSFLDFEILSYHPELKRDDRGYLFELVKSDHSGQIFVSRTRPGVTRGKHYHHTKVEKFCVVEGRATIKVRHLVTGTVQEFSVSGKDCVVVDIPPGCVHQITNDGVDDVVTLFWANEVFNPDWPDTFFSEV